MRNEASKRRIGAALAAAITMCALPANAGSPTLDEHYTVSKRHTFRIGAAHIGLSLTGDDGGLYVTETRPDIVLRRVNLKSGAVKTVRSFGRTKMDLSPVPGRPDILVAALPAGSRSRYDVRLVNRTTGADELLWTGTNGSLEVSPSGRWLATGTDHACYGGPDCFAQCLTVIDLHSESAAFDVPVPIDTQLREVYRRVDDPRDVKVEIRRKPLMSILGWSGEDELLVENDGVEAAYERRDDGTWVAAPSLEKPVSALEKGRPKPLAGALLRIPSFGHAPALDVPARRLFSTAPGPIALARGRRLLVAYKELLTASTDPATSVIEFVVLTPRR